ncbi:MAG TPA: FAD-linked oxidase C-terminal domain-containing protein [Longimicrobiales bacterium]
MNPGSESVATRPGGSRPEPDASRVDADALAAALRDALRGEVRFDAGDRALYSTDSSNYRQVPIGVVIPKDTEDVVRTVAIARAHGAPVLPRGGGTSLAGQCCNVAVVMDFSKYMHRLLELDPAAKRARVEPGIVLDTLRDAAERHHLTFGPDPATHNHCTLGGMIGNNSCGVHSVMAGRTAENVESLEVLTYDGLRLTVGPTSDEELDRIIGEGGRRGEIYARLRALRDRYAPLIRARYPRIPRRVSGYNLDELLPENGFHVARALVGSEGTCVTILDATLRLVDSPPGRALLVLGYPDIYSAGDHVPDILAQGPIGLEGIDDVLVDDMKKKGLHPRNLKLLPDGRGWLLVEFGGADRAEAKAKARALMDGLRRVAQPPSMKLFEDRSEENLVWQIRESGLGATARVPGEPDTWEGWEDSAVPPERVGEYLRDFRKLLDRYDYACTLYGHLGQGCIHTRIDFDLVTREGIEKFRAFLDDASDLVLRYGGSLSGEHGDGQSRAELLPKMFGPELVEAFAEFKAIWDPEGGMNPNKVVHPYRITENLRLGTSYRPPQWPTRFRYPEDNGSFARAQLRCVGVGECRRMHGGTMCPSYRATLEEMHSTRGRARLLFEMLEGDPLGDGWADPHVKEALDLCLACKGCRSDCPVNVDMATYKAEFLSHYHEHHRRPVTAYSMGLIDRWARLASHAPTLVNLVTRTPGLRRVAKVAAGIAPARSIPPFAGQTFRQWWRRRGAASVPAQAARGAGEAGGVRRAADGAANSPGASEAGGATAPGGAATFRGAPGRGRGAVPGSATADGSVRTVLLWADTFNNHFHPETAIAAVEVLEAAGFRVQVPSRPLCCGRPLYDFGMLDRARRRLRRILRAQRSAIRAGVPMVVLEPSCAAVFRDELVGFFPNDEDAVRLNRQTYLLSEFLERFAPDFRPPPLRRRAVVHGHCHQKAVMGFVDDEAVLERLGLDFTVLDSGCCGMAGSFGFERDKYDVSMKVGELVLLPAVRGAPEDALIVADGFSCREQIEQGAGRHALHLAEVIRLALREGERTGGLGGA